MSDGDWTLTERELPPQGEVVLTMDSSGHVERLKRNGQLWFAPPASKRDDLQTAERKA